MLSLQYSLFHCPMRLKKINLCSLMLRTSQPFSKIPSDATIQKVLPVGVPFGSSFIVKVTVYLCLMIGGINKGYM